MSDDSALQKAVLAELNWEPSVAAGHIGVTAEDGVVCLTGHVESFAEKHAAEVAACRVRGVTAVANELEVRLPFDASRDDEAIAAAAADRLAWNASVPAGAVVATVDQGWVTLAGEVDWQYQREAAEQDMRQLIGVVGLTNDITIRSKVSASNVSDDIMHALHRSWFFDPQTITVSVEDGRVRLGGTVHSPHERQVAMATAWAEPGVIEVEDEIAIL
ncbi:MAG: BON domain-containing protein [Caulobacteraceae bacterium]|nr:BON domain-containing protein [Caulobacteraceae bacterium]